MPTLGQPKSVGQLPREEFKTTSKMGNRDRGINKVRSRQHHVRIILVFPIYLALAERRTAHHDGAAEMVLQKLVEAATHTVTGILVQSKQQNRRAVRDLAQHWKNMLGADVAVRIGPQKIIEGVNQDEVVPCRLPPDHFQSPISVIVVWLSDLRKCLLKRPQAGLAKPFPSFFLSVRSENGHVAAKAISQLPNQHAASVVLAGANVGLPVLEGTLGELADPLNDLVGNPATKRLAPEQVEEANWLFLSEDQAMTKGLCQNTVLQQVARVPHIVGKRCFLGVGHRN